MKKLLISLSVLFVLFLLGCTSSPKPKSVDVLKKQCEKNHAHSCTQLGIRYHTGKGVNRNYSKMKDYLHKGCMLKDAQGCVLLGSIYSEGKSIKRDNLKAKQYYHQGCKLHEGLGCFELAKMYVDDTRGVKKNTMNAALYFSIACRTQYGGGCTGLANLHFDRKNYSESKRYASKGCDLNDAWGCFVVGAHYSAGVGVKQDFNKAQKYYKKACALGSTEACEDYQTLKRKGY